MFLFETVTELNDYVNDLISDDNELSSLSVSGEISGFKKYPSGHCYFSIKDDESVVSCVMFSTNAYRLDFVPTDGMLVNVSGKAGIYSKTGKYQLYISSMSVKGKGNLHEQYEMLFKKLTVEGLFDYSHKVKLPLLPKQIGIISSSEGAVIHDIVLTLKRRNPHFSIILYPCAVQGDDCPIQVRAGIDYFSKRNDIDVIIIARGGGSFEDLFGFNDEKLARAIYSCKIPIISAIGHEVDHTICDYVSDLRAATPTAAAELVLPRLSDLETGLYNLSYFLDQAATRKLESEMKRLNMLRNHKALYSPMFNVTIQLEKLRGLKRQLLSFENNFYNAHIVSLESLKNYLNVSFFDVLNAKKFEFYSKIDRIESMSPLKVLARGYSFVTDNQGKAVSDINSISIGDNIDITLSNGTASAQVIGVNENYGE